MVNKIQIWDNDGLINHNNKCDYNIFKQECWNIVYYKVVVNDSFGLWIKINDVCFLKWIKLSGNSDGVI